MSGFASAHHVLTFGAAGARGQTAAITALAAAAGVWAVRVHEARGSRDAVAVAHAWQIARGGTP